MTDTLKSDLNGVISALLEAGLGLKSTHVAAVEKAIAELDRLEAEVKKPRLPEGWSVLRHDDGSVTLKKDSDGGFSLRYSDHPETSSREDLALQFLSAFLPDVAPSTEPVQAADGVLAPKVWSKMGMPAEQLIAELRALSSGEDLYEMEASDELMAVAAEHLDDIYSGRTIVMPESVAHAKAMLLISERYIKGSAPAEVPNQDKGYQTPTNTETAKEYVGWTCGGCGGPVAGRFSTCENCGLEPMSSSGAHLKKTAAEKPKPVSLVDEFVRTFGLRLGYDDISQIPVDHDIQVRHFAWLLRTLDQERGV